MTVESVYNSLRKKSNGLVSFATVQKTYNMSTGSLNRGLEGLDTSEGIDLTAFQALVDRGIITLTSPDPAPIEGEIVDLTTQLALLHSPGSTNLPNQFRALTPVSPQSYFLNGLMTELQSIQAENAQLESEIVTLQTNRETGLKALEQVSILKAQLEARNRELRRAREIERIEAQTLEAHLSSNGILGKSSES
jgi:hypothetical protein